MDSYVHIVSIFAHELLLRVFVQFIGNEGEAIGTIQTALGPRAIESNDKQCSYSKHQWNLQSLSAQRFSNDNSSIRLKEKRKSRRTTIGKTYAALLQFIVRLITEICT